MPSLSEIRQQYPQYNDMTDAALADALYKKFYSDMPRADFNAKLGVGDSMDTAKGLAKAGGIGLAEGAIGVAGLPGTVVGGLDTLAGKIVDQTVGRAVNRYQKGTWDAPNTDAIAEQAKARMLPGPQDVISGGKIKSAIEGVTGDFYKPQTVGEQYARTIGEFIPGSLLAPGGPALNAVRYGVAPAVASETAGQLTKGSQYEPYARAGAGLATGLGAAMLSRPAYSERLVGRAARDVTNQDYAAAEQLMRDAQARGIQLTPAEAIQQVTGGGSSLGDIQRITESTRDGLARVMAQRPNQMRQAADAAFDQVAPRSATPANIGRQAQEAATSAIDRTRQNINRLAEPFYNAAETVPIPAAEQASLMALPGYQEALATVRKNPQLNRYVANLPDNSVGVLNEVKKQLNQQSQNVGAAVNPNRNVQMSAGYARDAGDVTNVGRSLSPEYGRALDIQEAGRRQVLGPLQAGPTGAISQTEDIASQGGKLFNNVNSPQEVRRAITNIAQQDPAAASGIVREQLGRMADKTVGGLDNAARPDQFGGAKLARMMRGDARTAENINAAVSAAAGQPAANDINKLIDALQATGWRQRPGSMTAFNQEALSELKSGGAEGVIRFATAPLKTARDTISRARLGSQTERLAELLASGPNGVRRIQELAARGDDRAAILARALLTYDAARQGGR